MGDELFACTKNNMALMNNHLDVGLLCVQVAQYIKLEIPVLQSFIEKLKEEENRELEKLKQRYVKFTPAFGIPSFTHTFAGMNLLHTTTKWHVLASCY